MATILHCHAGLQLRCLLLTYIIERAQALLPWNPQHLAGSIRPSTAFNTAASFTTNTNWQGYMPETTISYFAQMAGWPVTTFSARPGHRGRHCAGARLRPPVDTSATSGSISPASLSTSCCRSPIIAPVLIGRE